MMHIAKAKILVLILLFAAYYQNICAQTRVLITEVFFDPTPVLGLPDFEYIELHNPGPDTVFLEDWIWQVGAKSCHIETGILPPFSYGLLIPPKEEFPFLAPQILPKKWLSLSNSGQYIALLEPRGNVVHFVEYGPDMIQDYLKRQGGWSLELTCLNAPFVSASWRASVSAKGGSPGEANAVFCENYQATPLTILQVGLVDNELAILYLSDYIDPRIDTNHYQLELANRSAVNWHFHENRLNRLAIKLEDLPLGEGVEFFLKGEVSSCSGGALFQANHSWAFPSTPDSGDLIITEVMFEPGPEESEYIEIYNQSDKVVDLKDLLIVSLDLEGRSKDHSEGTKSSLFLFPGEYIAIAENSVYLESKFGFSVLTSAWEQKSLPSLSNGGGGLQILNQQQVVLDEMYYNPDFHYQALESTKGISLEKISKTDRGDNPNAWYSSASFMGGTPGQPNSQSIKTDSVQSGFELLSTVLTPNLDGLEDQAIIRYRMPERGYLFQVEVWALSGTRVRTICDWQLVSQEGSLTWSGTDDQGFLCHPGIYIFVINYRGPEGQAGRWKKAFAIRPY